LAGKPMFLMSTCRFISAWARKWNE